MKYTFFGEVENGKLRLYYEAGFREIVKKFDGKGVAVTIGEKVRQRTLPQNRYYWGVVVPVVAETLKEAGYEGVNKDTTHRLLKRLFINQNLVNEQTGETIEVAGTTAELSVEEFGEYIERITKWLAEEYGATIPLPDTQMELEI